MKIEPDDGLPPLSAKWHASANHGVLRVRFDDHDAYAICMALHSAEVAYFRVESLGPCGEPDERLGYLALRAETPEEEELLVLPGWQRCSEDAACFLFFDPEVL